MIEQIEWIACAERLPDDDITVLLYTPVQRGDVWPGWRDGDGWRWANGSTVRDEITHWAAWPAGPRG
jgi:hypothetical protein